MSEQQSKGSKLGTISGVIITIAFFLPWVRSCNTELSGYAIATNRNGFVEDSWVYWGALLAGLLCIAFFFLIKTNTSSNRIKGAVARLVVGLIGFLPILNIWYNVKQKGGAMEVLYGGWLIVLGYLGVFVSFFIDLGGTNEES